MASGRPDVASMAELQIANPALGDRAALETLSARNGYWFFRDVIDRDALDAFATSVLDVRKENGFADADAIEPRYNGASLGRFPARTVAGYEPLPELKGSRRWRNFLADPRVDGFFEAVLGARPDWVPVAELRVTPPSEALGDSPLSYPHQDGFYNVGYRCLTAWFPLFDVPREAGGLAVAEGMHRTGYFHDQSNPPRYPIPPGAVPDDAWRTTDYRAGDVVIFDRHLPHSGLRNRTRDRFRVSFDVRCVLPGDPRPVVGAIERIAEDEVVVRDDEGATSAFRLDQDSYCRGVGRNSGNRVTLSELAAEYLPGQEVMITEQDGVVKLLREPKY